MRLARPKNTKILPRLGFVVPSKGETDDREILEAGKAKETIANQCGRGKQFKMRTLSIGLASGEVRRDGDTPLFYTPCSL
jgi:hypothetical protein